MITEKDNEESEIIYNLCVQIEAGLLVYDDLPKMVSRIRAESAEQARKEAAGRAACAWREHGEDITLRILLDAIISTVNESFTVAPVSTDAEKLDIAELEKPADEDARSLVDKWVIEHLNKYESARTGHDDLAVRIQQYAESYHAEQRKECKVNETKN